MTRSFAFITGVLALTLLAGAAIAESAEYLGPSDVVAAPDGSRLFVICQDAHQIQVVDVAGGKVTRKIDCPSRPNGLAVSSDGKTLFIACGDAAGVVLFVEAGSGKTLASLPMGHTPTAPAVTPDGKRLYVCNRFNDNIAVIDVAQKKELAKIPVQREPFESTTTPDGKVVLVTNLLPTDASDSYDVAAVVNLIDTANHEKTEVRLLNGSSSVRGVSVTPDGKYAFVVHVLSRYQLPTTQLERGWINTNAMSIIDVAGRKLLNTVLLDEVDLGAATPWGVTCTADGASICVTHSGTHELSVINIEALMTKLASFSGEPKPENDSYGTGVSPPNDLAFLVDIRQRIRLQGRGPWGWLGADRTEANGPRGLAVVGNKAYVAMYFSDKLAVVDLKEDPRRSVSLLALGPQPKMSPQRLGEMNFHDAWLCFQHWQSCASCHPDGRVDGLNWDLLNDGLGNPKNAKSLLLSHATPPSMVSGVRDTAEGAVRSGFRHILFSVQPDDVLNSIDEYLQAMTPLPSPALVNGQLSEAAKRGKELFFSDRLGCANCHPEPHYTDLDLHDVGSKGKYDRRDTYDTPSLVECWRTAPYMHDGHYTTLKSLFTEGKHTGDDIEKLTDQEVGDLVEFVRSL